MHALRDRGCVPGHGNLVGELTVLPRAGSSDIVDVLAHQGKQVFGCRKVTFIAADHN